MDFDDTLEEAAFRAEVRTWLTENVEPRPRGPGRFFQHMAPGDK